MDIAHSKVDGGLAVALKRHYARNQRWGFIWAMWLAVLWGAWYVPSTALWYEAPYSNIPLDATSLRLAATAVMTWIHAIAVFFFLLLWNIVLGKVSDYGRTIVKFKQISKWYALASLCGGPLAIFGSCLAMFYAGPIFAAISSLLFPVVGAVIARLWYKEKISSRAALGMTIIIGGGVAIYAPGLFGEVSNTHPQAWIGYLGGAMSALGWGSEGAVARTTSGIGVAIVDTSDYPIAAIGTTFLTGWLSEQQRQHCILELKRSAKIIEDLLLKV